MLFWGTRDIKKNVRSLKVIYTQNELTLLVFTVVISKLPVQYKIIVHVNDLMQVFLSDVLQQRKLLLTCFDFISCFIPKGTYSTILVKGYISIYVQVTVYIKALLYIYVSFLIDEPTENLLPSEVFCIILISLTRLVLFLIIV